MSRALNTPDHQIHDRLDSWGEIATYLRRGIRTVRRWEREEALPVHRHLHRKSGSVYAFKSELDDWWKNRRPHFGTTEEKPPSRWVVWRWWALSIVLATAVVVIVWVKPLSSGRRATLPTVRAVAVMPFDDLSPNSHDDIFADAMTEELITSLAQVIPLHIASRDSVLGYEHSKKSLQVTARELNVDAVVKGSVQRDGQHVIITIRLIDARNDRHIWASSYDGVTNDILEFQEKTAHAAANKIRLVLYPVQPE